EAHEGGASEPAADAQTGEPADAPAAEQPAEPGADAGEAGEATYVVVIGGGNVGYYLTKELLAAGHEVVMIEKDPGRARTIADELGSIVIPNDGSEGRYQAEAGMSRADVVAAVTGDDEDNLVACQVAKM